MKTLLICFIGVASFCGISSDSECCGGGGGGPWDSQCRCTAPGTPIGNRCYFFSREALNFADARKYCTGISMTLSSLINETEHELMFEYFQSHGFGLRPRWITAHRVSPRSSDWYWDGIASPGETIDYFNWDYGQPDNKCNIEDCVQVHMSGNELVWNDKNCGEITQFICQAYCL